MKLARRIEDYLLVTVVAALVWLWAESNNVASYPADGSSVSVRLRVLPSGPGQIVTHQEPNQISLRFRGSQAQVGLLRSVLQSELEVRPDGLNDATSTLSVADLIGQVESLSNLAVNVTSVEPQTLTVTVDRLEPVEASVLFEPRDVVLGGPWQADPSTVRVTVPGNKAGVLSAGRDSAAVRVIPSIDLRELPAGEEQVVTARVQLPAELQGDPNVIVEPSEIQLTVIIDKRERDARLTGVAVFVNVLPSDTALYDVRMAEDSALIQDVTVTGPIDLVDSVVAGQAQVTAVLRLSTDDLIRAADTGVVQTGTVEFSLPTGLRIIGSPRTTVSYSVRRHSE